MGFRIGVVLPSAILLLFASFSSLAEEKKNDKEQTEQEALDEELDELKEDDYPDLVAADETGELMDEFAFLEEAAVVESAARHRQDIGMSPSAITVITREDIETSGATNLADLLRLVPGMDVAWSSPMYSSITTRLNWTTENNHFLVMVDGREANVELLGSTLLEVQPFFLEDVERIEIIRGPGSSLYGANALAGVVSITTRAVSEGTAGWARVAGGEPGSLIAGARASTRIADWGISLSGGADLSGRFVDPRTSGRQVWKLRSVVERRFSDTDILLVDGGFARGTGAVTSALGAIDFTVSLTSLRLAYESEDFRGQLYWNYTQAAGILEGPLEFGGIRLAEFIPIEAVGHTLDGEIQWTLPPLFKPLMVIVGGRGRVSWLGCDQFLDAETYSDMSSPRYHKAGISHWEVRTGAFVHGELSPTDWMTGTFGLRLDYNNITGEFLSPRLAAVFRPASGQFVRLGVARAFRKPYFPETDIHTLVEFPEESPLTRRDQELFQEFMTRVMGNNDLANEELLSFEAGYLGKFLDGKLSVAVDLYYNLYTNVIEINPDIIMNEQGLPDLDLSSYMFDNRVGGREVFGGELSVRANLSKSVSLVTSWSHREAFDHDTGQAKDYGPKNLITLGGRFRTSSGLLGSLYIFTRSEFWDRNIENPAGLMEPKKKKHMDNIALLLGKIGWRWSMQSGIEAEAGLKLFMPISPFSAPHFSFRERGGGWTVSGENYGGEELSRALTAYLQGSF